MSDITMQKDYKLWIGATADDDFDDLAIAKDVTDFEFGVEQDENRYHTQQTSDTGGVVTYGPKTYTGTINMIRREGETANEAEWQLFNDTASTDGARLTAAFVRGAIGTGEDADAKCDGWIGELSLQQATRMGNAGSSEAHVYQWTFTLEDAYSIASNTTDPRPAGS